MRTGFVQQLGQLERQLVDELGAAASALATIAAAIRDPSDRLIAEIADQATRHRTAGNRVHADLVIVTARQTPVASDLRLVLAMIDIAHHTTLIANQFDLISQELAEMKSSAPDRDDVADRLVRMSELASAQLREAIRAFSARDLAAARELDSDDDQLDLLNRQICDTVARLDVSPDERERGFHQMLIARSLERIGDNAVDIGEQAAFVLTAELQQFSDASRPRARRVPADSPDQPHTAS